MHNEKLFGALKLDRLSISYRVEMQPDEALAFVQRADAYNDFTQDDLARLVRSIGDVLPPMQFAGNPPNPNNGKPHHIFQIGNEGSRVIYLVIRKAYMPENQPGYWATELPAMLQSMGESANADECDVEKNEAGEFRYRFWWD